MFSGTRPSGFISFLGALHIIWFYATIRAFTSRKKGNMVKHENLMIYSYAATFGAVTLRIRLPLTTLLPGNFFKAYPIAAGLAFIPNIMIAFFIVRNKRLKFNNS